MLLKIPPVVLVPIFFVLLPGYAAGRANTL
jgi:uncharacterized membrane protein YjjB (DUF3815 family)